MSKILGRFVYKNGELIEKDAWLESFPGNSIYEVLRVVEGIPTFLDDHLERLYRSLDLAENRVRPDQAALKEDVANFLVDNKAGNANLRMVYVPLESSYDLHMYLIPTPVPEESIRTKGASLVTYRVDRENPNIKTVGQSYKDILEQEEFQGKYELLLLDSQGFIREGSRTNVFFIRDGKLVTPPVKGVLPGITRKKVLEICREEGIPVVEAVVSMEELPQISGIFLTGTSIGVLPVKDVDGIVFEIDHPIMEKLKEEYLQKEDQERKAYQKESGRF